MRGRLPGLAELAPGDSGVATGDGYFLPLVGGVSQCKCGKQPDQQVGVGAGVEDVHLVSTFY